MEKVTGIGGYFFKAKDPQKLAEWYFKYMGISKTPTTYEESSWWQDRGPTIFEPFDHTNPYLNKYERHWIINFRVKNLDAMVQQLTNAEIEVEVDPQIYPNGRFAMLDDPEGNPIQLWEPAGIDTL
ncbi:MAG TPA: VOC family protein [Saprospiraceae bacterium]|nr:VOC family protein [Saprospiraceae bacterium]